MMQVRLARVSWNRPLAMLVGLLCWFPASLAAQVERQNVAELTRMARDIVVGRIVEVRDGISAAAVPYTEVTLVLDRTLKGEIAGTHTFRQFGLLRPRPGPDGRTNLMVTPAGWPQYRTGEEVMLFLYHPAERTGLRSTVGLAQGAFSIRDGLIVSQAGNVGLFDGVDVPQAQRRRLQRVRPPEGRGPVAAEDFIEFVDAAVREGWFAEAP